MVYTTVAHCGNDHQEWLKNMDFFKEEFDLLDTRLLEIAGKNNTHEVMPEIEHFQNQFIIQRNNINKLKHQVRDHNIKVAADVQQHNGKIEQAQVEEHDLILEEFTVLEKNITELRHEFNRFLSKWM